MDDTSNQKSAPRKETEVAADAPSPERNLSSEIERAVDREPLDRVRCVRVFGNYYRCNWWSHLGGPRASLEYNWAGRIRDFVRKSRFLSASMEAGALVIKEVDETRAEKD